MPDGRRAPLVLAIVGATATGKSSLALHLAPRLGAEIVSVDSVQVYRGMDIGSAKPTSEEQAQVRHHLIDVLEPGDELDAHAFRSMATRAIADVLSRNKLPMLVGGSALYFTAITTPVEFRPTDPEIRAEIEHRLEHQGLQDLVESLLSVDPDAADSVDLANPRRVVRAFEAALISAEDSNIRPGRRRGPAALAAERNGPFPVRLIGLGLSVAPKSHARRIHSRVVEMIDQGLEREVREIFRPTSGMPVGPDSASPPSRTARQALGYKEVAEAIASGNPCESAIDGIVARTRQLSRRQHAWFRKDPRLSWLWSVETKCDRRLSAAHRYFEERLRSAREGSGS